MIKNEMIKLYKSKKLLVLFIAIFLLLISVIAGHQLEEYENKKMNIPEITQEELYEANKENFTYLMNEKGYTEKQLMRTTEKMEAFYSNSIPFEGYKTGAFYLFEEISNGVFLLLLLPFTIFLIGIEAIIGESNRDSLNLMLISPNARNKVILSKFFSISLTIVLTGIIYTTLFFLYIASQYGFTGWSDLVVMMAFKPTVVPIWQAIIYSVPYVLLMIFIYTLLGLFFSVLFRSYSGAFIGFLAIFLLRGFSGAYVDKVPLSEYLPFLNFNLNAFLFSNPSTELMGITFIFSLISTIITFILMFVFTLTIFTKRDIY